MWFILEEKVDIEENQCRNEKYVRNPQVTDVNKIPQ